MASESPSQGSAQLHSRVYGLSRCCSHVAVRPGPPGAGVATILVFLGNQHLVSEHSVLTGFLLSRAQQHSVSPNLLPALLEDLVLGALML